MENVARLHETNKCSDWEILSTLLNVICPHRRRDWEKVISTKLFRITLTIQVIANGLQGLLAGCQRYITCEYVLNRTMSNSMRQKDGRMKLDH